MFFRIFLQYGLPGEVFAKGLGGGIFSWSYYGTSDGIEANTRDTYTEHVMRCRWGRTAESMQSWMVARRWERAGNSRGMRLARRPHHNGGIFFVLLQALLLGVTRLIESLSLDAW